jgi:hypothetical protein
MKVLKGFGLAILGFLLSMSLILFGFLFTINQTVLNPDFVASQVEELDMPSLAEEIFSEQVPQEQGYMSELVAEAANNTIIELESWVKQQADTAIHTFYDYIKGKSDSLNLTIPIDTVKASLRDNLLAAELNSPPPKFEGLSPAEIELEFNQFWSEYSEEIPSTLEIDESLVGAEVMANFEQAREYVGYFNITFRALIGFILLLILGIVLIYREVKGSTRQIGITSLTCGIVSFVGPIIINSIAGSQLAQQGIPAYLQEWLPQLIKDVLMPLEMYGIGLMAAGVILIIVSFVYKRREEYSY